MLTIILTDSFKKDYSALTNSEQKQVRKTLRKIADTPQYPSLQVHKIRGTIYWEAYVNKDLRLVFEQSRDTLVLHAVGHHDILRKF
ncbi:MAG: type II toxin-antitoxin system YafQ family toxin [Thermicanus sp.]|nr:type II toxin-antitoxin system YafQ family toxin [Thermicanus sp.]